MLEVLLVLCKCVLSVHEESEPSPSASLEIKGSELVSPDEIPEVHVPLPWTFLQANGKWQMLTASWPSASNDNPLCVGGISGFREEFHSLKFFEPSWNQQGGQDNLHIRELGC